MATYEIQSLWDLFMRMLGLLSSGMAGLFAVGMFTRRANGRGALVGAVISAAVIYWVQTPYRRQLLPVRGHRPAHLLRRRLPRQPAASRPPQRSQGPDRLHPNPAGTDLASEDLAAVQPRTGGFYLGGTDRGRYGTGHIMRAWTGQCAWSRPPERREFADLVFSRDAPSHSQGGLIATR